MGESRKRSEMREVRVLLPRPAWDRIRGLVESGKYASASEFIRRAVWEKLEREGGG